MARARNPGRLTAAQLDAIESKWSPNSPLQKVTDTDRLECLRMVEEIRWLRSLLLQIYPHVGEPKHEGELLAELEQEVMATRSEKRK